MLNLGVGSMRLDGSITSDDEWWLDGFRLEPYNALTVWLCMWRGGIRLRRHVGVGLRRILMGLNTRVLGFGRRFNQGAGKNLTSILSCTDFERTWARFLSLKEWVARSTARAESHAVGTKRLGRPRSRWEKRLMNQFWWALIDSHLCVQCCNR